MTNINQEPRNISRRWLIASVTALAVVGASCDEPQDIPGIEAETQATKIAASATATAKKQNLSPIENAVAELKADKVLKIWQGDFIVEGRVNRRFQPFVPDITLRYRYSYESADKLIYHEKVINPWRYSGQIDNGYPGTPGAPTPVDGMVYFSEVYKRYVWVAIAPDNTDHFIRRGSDRVKFANLKPPSVEVLKQEVVIKSSTEVSKDPLQLDILAINKTGDPVKIMKSEKIRAPWLYRFTEQPLQ